MDRAHTNIEEDALRLAREVLAEYREALTGLGLRCRSPQLQKSQVSGDDEEEISIYVDDEDGIFDVIEFFIVRSGKVVASLEEIEAWLRETVGDVIKRRRVHMRGMT